MLPSIFPEPGIFGGLLTTSGLCSFTPAVWRVTSSSLPEERSHSLSSSIKSGTESTDNAPVFSSAAGVQLSSRWILRSPPENCSFWRSKWS